MCHLVAVFVASCLYVWHGCVWRMHAKAVDSASEASDSEQSNDDDDDDDGDGDARRRSSRHVTR